MLLKIMNAKRTLEVGVFTGYSLLITALALPDDAKIVAVDPDRESYEAGTVAASEEDDMEDYLRQKRKYVITLNSFLAEDSRIELAQLSIGDGLTLCGRLE